MPDCSQLYPPVPSCNGTNEFPVHSTAAGISVSISVCKLASSSPRCTQLPMNRGKAELWACGSHLCSSSSIKESWVQVQGWAHQSFPNVPLLTYYTPFNWNFCHFPEHSLPLSVSALGLVFSLHLERLFLLWKQMCVLSSVQKGSVKPS